MLGILMHTRTAFHSFVDMDQPLKAGDGRLQVGWSHPAQILQAHDAAGLRTLLQQVEAAARAGWWCVGGLRYEAASALDARLLTQPAASPLAWFALYPAPTSIAMQFDSHVEAEQRLEWKNTLSWESFDQGMAQIHAGIAAGDYYQINYTHRLQGHAANLVQGPALFAALQRAQPGGYAVYLDLGDEQVASVSPELFFDWHQPAQGMGDILTRPMKGTATRAATPQADAQQAQHLQTSIKERAENVMIVDLLRNDLGKLAVTGSVQVPVLFEVRALPTVWQMTSDVRARLPQGTSLQQVFEALFPCGSVTGAPKRSAMAAIASLEQGPRGWYCGALGVVRPDGGGGLRATFNVPIRTVVVQGAQLYCGIGSGITADARADGEWSEWHAKRGFVERASQPFEVLETLALQDGQFRHRALHLQRMQQGALHFGHLWNAEAVQAALQALVHAHPQGLWRVRLTLRADGLPHAQAYPCAAPPERVVLQMASQPLQEAHSEFVRFKTTRRDHYERFAPVQPEVFDTVLWNTAGEITEGTRGNIAALIEGQWVTPPLSCGLLNGVGRQVALAQGRMVEGTIRRQDVPAVREWAFINSLRGWIAATLLPAVDI